MTAPKIDGGKGDNKLYFIDDETAEVTLNELANPTASAHATSHESGGTDEIDLTGLDGSGLTGITTSRVAVLKVIADDTALTTGNGKMYFTVPAELNGMNLVTVGAHVYTVSSSGAITVQIHNLTDSADMLSTAITIDAGDKDSKDATTAAVIDTTHDDVATGDEIRIDVDGAGTDTRGLEIRLGFE